MIQYLNYPPPPPPIPEGGLTAVLTTGVLIMKKSVLEVLTSLKEVLEVNEHFVLELHSEGKNTLTFTITKNHIKGGYSPKGSTKHE